MEDHAKELRNDIHRLKKCRLFDEYDTDYIVQLFNMICGTHPPVISWRKWDLFRLAKHNGNIAICERLELPPSDVTKYELERDYPCYNVKQRKYKLPTRHPAFTKWLHEVRGCPMDYTLELKYMKPPVDEWMLKYMRERYDAGANVAPLRVGNSRSSLRAKVVTPKLVMLIKKYNIPIHEDCVDKYEKYRRKTKGGLWDIRRDLVLWRRTMWK